MSAGNGDRHQNEGSRLRSTERPPVRESRCKIGASRGHGRESATVVDAISPEAVVELASDLIRIPNFKTEETPWPAGWRATSQSAVTRLRCRRSSLVASR